MIRTIYLVEIGEYDDRQIIGAYSCMGVARKISEIQKERSRIIEFTVEEDINLYSVFKAQSHENIITERVEQLTTYQLIEHLKNSPSRFYAVWVKGYKSACEAEPRKFGSYCAWGFSKEEAMNNLLEGIKNEEE